MGKEKSTTKRARNYATVVYPESAPDNWIDILSEHHIPALISPLHDNDTCANGEPKKAHYHVMLMYDGVKTKEQVSEVFNAINGVGVEVVNTIRGYARYLCHLDDPNKARYSITDVIALSGADYQSLISLPSDKYAIIREMIRYCKENNILAYSELLEYSMDNRDDWFNVLCDNGSYVMKEYLKSHSWRISQGK